MLPHAVNHLLSQESWARAQLLPHAGKVACLDAGVATIRLKVTADGMAASASVGEPIAVTIRIRPADLPLILQNPERAFSYVKIDGDADFANTISTLSRTVRWDVAGDLSHVVGDVAAQRVVDGATAAAATVRSTGQKLMENVAEYFLEEDPMLIRPQAVTDFTADVTRLRDDVERLAKRIERLK
ncbi:MAG: sterol-binding protein [Herminiimonas sp.]|nr:sterol-binding protein [Herminiimonas sp.]